MSGFDYKRLANLQWDNEMLRSLTRIYECRGRQQMFFCDHLKELYRLELMTQEQNTMLFLRMAGARPVASNRLQKLVLEVSDPETPQEKMAVGYWTVWEKIHAARPQLLVLSPALLLQMHEDLKKGGEPGMRRAAWEPSKRYMMLEKGPAGASFAQGTQSTVLEICRSYYETLEADVVDPLILLFTAVCDLFCVEPFSSDNESMSRLLTSVLLRQNGYQVEQLVSLDAKLAEHREEYQKVLQEARERWCFSEMVPVSFLKFMLRMLGLCCQEFEEKVGMWKNHESRSVYQVVLAYVSAQKKLFTGREVVEHCPVAARSAVLASLKQMCREGVLEVHGAGRSTRYRFVKLPAPQDGKY